MKDSFYLKFFKISLRTKYILEWWVAKKLSDKSPPYKLGGDCHQCGKCCENPTIQVSWVTFHFRMVKIIYLQWQKFINGFYYVDKNDNQQSFIFICHHYNSETKECDSYSSRPGMCYLYPKNLMQSSSPDLFEECGYDINYKKSKLFKESLDKLSLTEKQKEDLQKKLHLK